MATMKRNAPTLVLLAIAFVALQCTQPAMAKVRRDLLQTNATGDAAGLTKSAVQSNNPQQLESAVKTGKDQDVISALADQLAAGSGSASQVVATVGQISSQASPTGNAAVLPNTAQELKQTTGATPQQLFQGLPSEAQQKVSSNPSQLPAGAAQVVVAVGGTGNTSTGGSTGGGSTGGSSGSSGSGSGGGTGGDGFGLGRRLQQQIVSGGGGLPQDTLQLLRQALAIAICRTPESAAGALARGIPSDDKGLATATLLATADASNSCCDKANTALSIAYGNAQKSGNGPRFVFRVFFAIIKLGLGFCAVPLAFFGL